ncbi:hypothetical protein R70006_06243 [Paraburkholderia domus]|uniref:DUF1007 family protein n=1 Tax=Paraburkholderia domus TaxID=2793075 RepID=UPI0019148889|nr:DUF1007 family protein [Paraburkholderia domus]MBK5052874.1 DUF1007 family protein [Burkholderia sp. R-70006]CAE6821930.1 hypothetical protein R70006_06243 [Paraburkholderia domus]
MTSAMGLRVRQALGALCVGLSAAAQAHPHVWITQSIELEGKGTVISGLREKWEFTHGFPVTTLIDPASIPRSGPFDARATATLRKEAFESLKDDGYFTHVYAGGKAVATASPQSFAASIENGNLVYTFLIPLKTPLDPSRISVAIGIWDDSFFVDVQPSQMASALPGPAVSKTCHGQVFEDRGHPIYGGAIFPIATHVTC